MTIMDGNDNDIMPTFEFLGLMQWNKMDIFKHICTNRVQET